MVVMVTLGACGSSDVLDPPDVQSDEALIQISSEGGFVPVEFNINNGPTFTVTRSGQFIFPGAQTLEYPGPLLPATLEGQLDDDENAKIVALVEEMGISEMDEEADDTVTNVADASTGVIKYWDESGVHKYSVYALGISDQHTAKATIAFAELFDYLHQLSGSVEGTPYAPEQVRVVSSADYAGPDPNFVDIRPWPLAGENPDEWKQIAEVGEQVWTCKTFEVSVTDALGDATQVTVWNHPSESADAQNFRLYVRPIHPGEEDCTLS